MSKFRATGLPWTGRHFGTDVSDCHTAQEVMEKANLNWTVDKCPLVAKMPFNLARAKHINDESESGLFSFGGNMFQECPNAFATYRTDWNIPLGIVKNRYEVVQNSDAFAFFNDAIGEDKALWQTAGAFGNGERIFVSAKLPDDIRVNGDKIDTYLVFTSNHDGNGGITILFTPIRVICQNTLNAALRTTDCYITFKHTQNVHEKLIGAKEILGITKQQTEATTELYEAMAKQTYTDDEIKEALVKLYLNSAEFAALMEYDSKFGVNKLLQKNYYTLESTKISTRKANMLAAIYDYYQNGIGQENILGTGWGLYNAITGYYSNVANLEGEKRMDSLLYGNAAKFGIKAANIAIAEAA